MPCLEYEKAYHVLGYSIGRLSSDKVCVRWSLRMRKKPYWLRHKEQVLHIMKLQNYLEKRLLPPIEERRKYATDWFG